MIIKKDIFKNSIIDLKMLDINQPEKVLFLDIETTGLSWRNSSIYMIGLTSYINNNWTFIGLFAETPSNEQEILDELLNILSSYDTLIHFNGNRFDLPFIKERAKIYNIDINFEDFKNIDLYKRISSFKHLLGIGNCKQKTIELFLGINRDDQYDGGQLINVYKEYIISKDENLFQLLYQHNHDDLLGMLEIMPIFLYEQLDKTIPELSSISENEFTDFNGNCCMEINAEFNLPFSLPAPVSLNKDKVFISIKDCRGYLRIPLIYCEMRHYFEDYKNYYYLPKEDMAVHKSVAGFVDKDFRQKATKENCYIKKTGVFIPAYNSVHSVIFKNDYNSVYNYIEFTKELSQNTEFIENYFNDFLNNAYKKR